LPSLLHLCLNHPRNLKLLLKVLQQPQLLQKHTKTQEELNPYESRKRIQQEMLRKIAIISILLEGAEITTAQNFILMILSCVLKVQRV
jgi:hypothetical protein